MVDSGALFPLPLDAYPAPAHDIFTTLSERVAIAPFNMVATAIFLAAVVHTFIAPRIMEFGRGVQARHDAAHDAAGAPRVPSVAAELLHFLGEIEVVFGLWAVPLMIAIAVSRGWATATHYLNDTVNFTEPLFVIVIMALASTQPIVDLAEHVLQRIADLARGTVAAWWFVILTMAPLLGSVITEPAAMTIAALLLGRHFFARDPGTPLKYATLGLLFVNVSIGGTLTHFAAPPVLMVARPWGWDALFMLTHFGWRAMIAVAVSTGVTYLWFRRELHDLATRAPLADLELTDDPAPVRRRIPAWVTLVHVAFMVWTVANAHYPVLVLGGFLFFLGFDRATAVYSTLTDFKTPLLVGFFLAGLVIHGGLQGWWIAPVLSSLPEVPLFAGATVLTAFNDNALITYLATLVPNLDPHLQIAVVEGAVTGGGLTVIANAPNPAGQALLGRYFGGTVHPLSLFLGAAVPTLIAAAMFRLL
jgi:hypothetical protein